MTPSAGDVAELSRAAWRTWGARGLARRATYEVRRRAGRTVAAESRWQERRRPLALRSAGIAVPVVPIEDVAPPRSSVELYGGLVVADGRPPDWHRHPLTGHRYPADVHWSALSDADPEAGDIKDVWDLSRFGWLFPDLRRWAATGDDEVAEGIWGVIESWYEANPPYRGVHWMCGQETSLRTIATLLLADALRDSPTTTDARRDLVGRMVFDAVGRVAPTLGYAMSQRNNHAVSEAGFLWSASVLAPDLPGAARLRDRAASALTEMVEDQFAPDGSYSQHAPTYERVAMQVLLWCPGVARATGVPAPVGVVDAVHRGAAHLRSLLVPGSEGRVPNLGANDGAHVFPLTARPIVDFRPLLVHARSAVGGGTDLAPGPWDEEAAWFGLEPRRVAAPTLRRGRTTRAMTVGGVHAVLRAGALDHRPAHADQLHLDVWLEGRPVAVDAGSYRYTAPSPWANALAGDDVHNVPRVEGDPQAVRAGRFFWRHWAEAEVVESAGTDGGEVRTARLVLPGGATLIRSVRVGSDRVVVVDRIDGGGPGVVRWNLVGGPRRLDLAGGTMASGEGWTVEVAHPGDASWRSGSEGDPTSGWVAPTYAVLEPVVALEVPLVPERPTVTVFSLDDGIGPDGLDRLVAGSD